MNADSTSPFPLRLLHLEDSIPDAVLIAEVLRTEWSDCRITRVQTGPDFMRALQSSPFDLILSDFSMPGFNGLAALKLAHEHTPGIPFVFLSGTIGEENAVEALKQGATDYVIKDRMARLVPAVRRALSEVKLRHRRNNAEQQLRESQERFQQLAEQSKEVFWFVALNPEEILYIGPAIGEIWGLPAEEFYANPRAWMAAIQADDQAKVRQAYDDCIAGRTPRYEQEYRVIRPDGTMRWVLDSATIMRDPAGKAVRLSGIAKDITERKISEQRLREQAELLDKAHDAIVVSDLDRRIVYWNQGAVRLFGWTAAEAVGRRSVELFGPTAQAEIDAVRGGLTADEWRGEVSLKGKDGRPLTLESSVTVIRDDAGRPKSRLIISTDITEQKQLERQFLRAQRMESIGTLAGGIAHDLNNVLAPILMAVHLVQKKTDHPDIHRLMGVLETSAQRGASLIKQVLAFARGAEGARSDLQLPLVLREVVTLLGETLPKSIAVEMDLAPDLALINADATQMSQVLMNLCVNARDAMPVGGRLSIRMLNVNVSEILANANPGAKAGRHVLVVVEDTGTGIPPEIVERIFDPFFTTKSPGKGTGLGLSTVLGIVKDHEGFLQVQSTPGTGTKFSLFLPALSGGSTAGQTKPAIPIPEGRGETVLIIDDETGIRELMKVIVESSGYRALVAADGPAGIALYAQHRDEIRVVLTDMMMPAMQGAEVILELRTINPDVRIVAMSGILGEHLGVTGDAGHLTFLQKPMTAPEVLAAIQRVLPRSLKK